MIDRWSVDLRIATCALLGIASCGGDAPGVSYTKIDDMEGASGLIEWTPPAGSPGGWDSYVDAECDHILPMPRQSGGTWSYDPVPAPYETLFGITSGHAARLQTTLPLHNIWGAAMGFDFAVPPASPNSDGASPDPPNCAPSSIVILATKVASVDLNGFEGISFWGMATAGAGTGKVWVRIDDWNTDPRGGRCDPKLPDSPQEACFNSFRFAVELTSTFSQYTVYFSQLTQGAFGHQAPPSGLDRRNIFSLGFEVDTPGGVCPPPNICAGVPPTLTFDIWIDDLYFVNR